MSQGSPPPALTQEQLTLIAQLQREKAELTTQIASEVAKSEGNKDVARITNRGTIITAIVGGALLLGQAGLNAAFNDPPVVSCGKEILSVVEVLEKEPTVWSNLSGTSEVQKQCKVNEYVVKWQKANGVTPQD